MKNVSLIKIFSGTLFIGFSILMLSCVIANLFSISFGFAAFIITTFCYPIFDISWSLMSSRKVSREENASRG